MLASILASFLLGVPRNWSIGIGQGAAASANLTSTAGRIAALKDFMMTLQYPISPDLALGLNDTVRFLGFSETKVHAV